MGLCGSLKRQTKKGSSVMSTRTGPRVFVESVDGITVVTFAETRLVVEDVLAEVGELLGLIDGPGLARVLINFREVQFMSSSFLAVLMKLSRRVAEANGQIKLCSIVPDLKKVFKITCFDRLFEIYEDEGTALDSFSR
jgi:anti-sigma B factor antagonist